MGFHGTVRSGLPSWRLGSLLELEEEVLKGT